MPWYLHLPHCPDVYWVDTLGQAFVVAEMALSSGSTDPSISPGSPSCSLGHPYLE